MRKPAVIAGVGLVVLLSATCATLQAEKGVQIELEPDQWMSQADLPQSSLKDSEKVEEKSPVKQVTSPARLQPSEVVERRTERQWQAMQETLILARAEAEYFRQKWSELNLKNEVLGINAMTADEQLLADKLAETHERLHQAERHNQDLREVLALVAQRARAWVASSEAMKASMREEFEVATRKADQVMRGQSVKAGRTAQDLSDAEVVLVDADHGLFVLNAGRNQGVHVGMPFRVVRGNQVLGRCRVMETREDLSAAMIQAESGKNVVPTMVVQAGDRLLPELAGK